MTAPTALDLLERRLVDAAAALDTGTGGAAVCAPARAGTRAPAAKYLEGRWAALHEVSRACRRSQLDVVIVAGTAREPWAAHLARLHERSAGADWIAYRSGGLDALTELVQDLPGRLSPDT